MSKIYVNEIEKNTSQQLTFSTGTDVVFNGGVIINGNFSANLNSSDIVSAGGLLFSSPGSSGSIVKWLDQNTVTYSNILDEGNFVSISTDLVVGANGVGSVKAGGFYSNVDSGTDNSIDFYSIDEGVFNFHGKSQSVSRIINSGFDTTFELPFPSMDFKFMTGNSGSSSVGFDVYGFEQDGGGSMTIGDFNDPTYLFTWNYAQPFGNSIVTYLNIANTMEFSTQAVSVFVNLDVFGNKNFRIDHPLKPETHDLVHTVIESNRGDVFYRGKLTLVNGKSSLDIDDYVGLTRGTFSSFTKDAQVFTTNESGWDSVKGSIQGSVLTVFSNNNDCNDEISWLILAERNDYDYINSSNVDENGRLILEQESEGRWRDRLSKKAEEAKKNK